MIVQNDDHAMRKQDLLVDELAAPILAALKTEHKQLWDRVKAHEADGGAPDEDALLEMMHLIHNMDEQLSTLDIGRALVRLREIALMETNAMQART